LALWETGWYEARLLASMVDDPAQVTSVQMERWVRDFDNWAVVDTVCFKLFDRTPHAFAKIEKWAKACDEFVKRAGFALLACVALHTTGVDEDFLRSLALIERGAEDDRNFVKKGVSWALRAIGGKKSPHSGRRRESWRSGSPSLLTRRRAGSAGPRCGSLHAGALKEAAEPRELRS
jgi:3-methyladenine DNA glycosylase AlkD